MLRFRKNRSPGFTLVELAIVLGVAGILIGGLWRLFSSGNLQMRDQAAASQQSQLINAVSAYLQSTTGPTAGSSAGSGQTFLANLPPTTPTNLPLPDNTTNADTAGGSTCTTSNTMLNAGNPDTGLCNFLPTGFSQATTNSYGQKYTVRVLKDNTTNTPPTPPQTYSFMILTSGGDVIADSSGGRISAMIGGDGGFVYSSNVCGTPTSYACGSYGSWAVTLTTYGFTAPANGGYIASRTYYSPLQNLSYWLARENVPGDTSHVFNTLQTNANLYLSSTAGEAHSVNFGPYGGIATSGSGVALNAQSGVINMQGGTIYTSDSGGLTSGGTFNLGSTGSLVSGGAGVLSAGISLNGNTMTTGNALFAVNGGCTSVSGEPHYNAACTTAAVQIQGDMSVNGQLTTYSLYAGTFVYQSSDMRLKTDIKSLNDPLADIMKVKPVSFTLKATGQKSMGVIAQDLEKTYPDLVTNGSTGFKAVNYDGLIAPLIGAVQQLKKENEDLHAQLTAAMAHEKKIDGELQVLRQK